VAAGNDEFDLLLLPTAWSRLSRELGLSQEDFLTLAELIRLTKRRIRFDSTGDPDVSFHNESVVNTVKYRGALAETLAGKKLARFPSPM